MPFRLIFVCVQLGLQHIKQQIQIELVDTNVPCYTCTYTDLHRCTNAHIYVEEGADANNHVHVGTVRRVQTHTNTRISVYRCVLTCRCCGPVHTCKIGTGTYTRAQVLLACMHTQRCADIYTYVELFQTYTAAHKRTMLPTENTVRSSHQCGQCDTASKQEVSLQNQQEGTEAHQHSTGTSVRSERQTARVRVGGDSGQAAEISHNYRYLKAQVGVYLPARGGVGPALPRGALPLPRRQGHGGGRVCFCDCHLPGLGGLLAAVGTVAGVADSRGTVLVEAVRDAALGLALHEVALNTGKREFSL